MSSDQSFVLEDLDVFFVRDVQELADVVHVGAGHGLAVVLLDEVGWLRVEVL